MSVRRILIQIFVLGVAIAHAQTITKVAGDGQLVIQSIQSSNKLVVLVRDAGGNPVKNVAVKWAVTSGPGNVVLLTQKTDETGQQQAAFVAAVPDLSKSYATSTVTATYNGVSVQFTELSVGETSNVPNVQAYPDPLPSGANLSGQAGQQGSVPINVKFLVTSGPQSGQGVGGVAIAITTDPNDPSKINCAGGISYSNAAGVATCTLVYGGKIGAGSFDLSAGGLTHYTYTYHVTAGAPAAVNIISGNNQSGRPGQTLPSPLLAQVTDIGGNILSGIPMTFSSVVQDALTFSHFNAATDGTGRISAIVTLGNTVGAVQAKLSTADGKAFTLFTITVNIVVAGMSKISGDGQSVLVNAQFPDPLVVEVIDPNNRPVAGAPVTFALTSGSAALGNTSVTTDANGQASTTVIAGPTAGPIAITASTVAGTNVFSQLFNLSSTPPGPVCDPENTFFNGTSYVRNFISPGGVALMYCSGIAQGIQGVVSTNTFGFEPLPTTVQGVTVQFNPPTGPFAPIYYLANINGKESIAIQVPFEITPGQVPVEIKSNGEPNVNPLTAPVLAAAPGFFETVMSDGKSRAVLLRPDGSVVQLDHKARKGETIRAFVTGLIPPVDASGNSVIGTNNYVPVGSDITITTPIVFGIDHKGFGRPTVIYAHNLIGVWEVEFTIPDSVPSGNDVALDIAVPLNGKNVFAKGTKIPIF